MKASCFVVGVAGLLATFVIYMLTESNPDLEPVMALFGAIAFVAFISHALTPRSGSRGS